MHVLKNCKQLFLSVTYSVFIGRGEWGLFVLIPHQLPKKYPREKILDPRDTDEEIFGPMTARWHETHGIYRTPYCNDTHIEKLQEQLSSRICKNEILASSNCLQN